MGKIKGCVNETCVDYKKRKFKSTDQYCVHCGKELYFVCRDCWTTISDDKKVQFCMRCKAKRDDEADKRKSAAGKVALGVGGIVLGGLATLGSVFGNSDTKA